ncbi:hypothetical protein EDD21DRAFT_364934 [Dissophora ornata]|nr:hypothetical protein EDD21DRAFT_364934 [Dissophora ornata]
MIVKTLLATISIIFFPGMTFLFSSIMDLIQRHSEDLESHTDPGLADHLLCRELDEVILRPAQSRIQNSQFRTRGQQIVQDRVVTETAGLDLNHFKRGTIRMKRLS